VIIMTALSEPAVVPAIPAAVESAAVYEPPLARRYKDPRAAPVMSEPLSPFMPWSQEERAPLPEGEDPTVGGRSLLADLLREPSAIVDRVLDPARVQAVVLGSMLMIVLGTSFFASAVCVARGDEEFWWLAAAVTSVNVLMSLAASLGPIYATGILVAARVPLARLVASLVSSTAAGSLVLAGLAPPLYLMWRLDPEWSGPLMVVASFLLAGAAAGARIHRQLSMMAETVTRAALGEGAKLSAEDAFRVGILARVSWMMSTFTLALGFWAFNALG
jgi:hypothetical protein